MLVYGYERLVSDEVGGKKCRMLSSRKKGQWMAWQVSPRFRQLGGRWCWDPGASASVIWAYTGVLLRMTWIRRGRGVKEKGGILEVPDGCRLWVLVTSWICDSCNGVRDQSDLNVFRGRGYFGLSEHII